MYYSINDFYKDVGELIDQIKNSCTITSMTMTYKGIFGIPRNGQLLAQALSYKLEIPLLSKKQYIASTEKSKILVVDSNDSKRDDYPDSDFACLHINKIVCTNSINYAVYSLLKDEIQYWWEDEEEEEKKFSEKYLPESESRYENWSDDIGDTAEQGGMGNSQRIQVLNHATTCMLHLDEMIKELS